MIVSDQLGAGQEWHAVVHTSTSIMAVSTTLYGYRAGERLMLAVDINDYRAFDFVPASVASFGPLFTSRVHLLPAGAELRVKVAARPFWGRWGRRWWRWPQVAWRRLRAWWSDRRSPPTLRLALSGITFKADTYREESGLRL